MDGGLEALGTDTLYTVCCILFFSRRVRTIHYNHYSLTDRPQTVAAQRLSGVVDRVMLGDFHYRAGHDDTPGKSSCTGSRCTARE
jgi:hypothetical protein